MTTYHGKRENMSKIVWTPETGWTDDGPEADLTLDSRGRIVGVPRRANQPHRRTELERDTHLALTSAWAAPVGTAHRRPLVAAVLVGGLIALASACSTPQPQISQPAYAVPKCSDNPAASFTIYDGSEVTDAAGNECDLTPPQRLDVLIHIEQRFVGDQDGAAMLSAAVVICNGYGGAPVLTGDPSALLPGHYLRCRTVNY